MKRILSLFIGFCLIAWPVWATAPSYTYTAAMIANPNIHCTQFTANPGTYKTVYTGITTGGQISKINQIYVGSTDSGAAHLVTCQLYDGSLYYVGGAATVAESAGYANAVPGQNLINSTAWATSQIDAQGNNYILIPTGWTLACTYATALTTGLISVCAMGGGDY